MKAFTKTIILFVSLFVLSMNVSFVSANEFNAVDVGYQTVINNNLSDFSYGGALSGNENGDFLQAIGIHLVNAPYEAKIEYRIYSEGAWQTWSSDFTLSPSVSSVLGIQVRLVNFPNAEVHYQSYRKGLGWGNWVKNGATSGSLNTANPLTGIRIKVFEIGIQYQSHINQTLSRVYANNEVLGVGNLETLSVSLQNPLPGGRVVYRAHLKDVGWTAWANNGAVVGRSGSGQYIEAIEAYLENMPGYHMQYQVRIGTDNWSVWTSDYGFVGNIGENRPIDAYRFRIVKAVYVPKATVVVEEPFEVGSNPNTTSLLYSASQNASVGDLAARNAANLPALTPRIIAPVQALDADFDDSPGGVNIGINDQFYAPNVVNYEVGDRIPIPNTFSDWGDNMVHNDQFEVFFGYYNDNKIFTVIATPYELYNISHLDTYPATHTLILYDNDTESFLILDGFVIPGVFFEASWFIDDSDPEQYYMFNDLP